MTAGSDILRRPGDAEGQTEWCMTQVINSEGGGYVGVRKVAGGAGRKRDERVGIQ